VPSCQTEIDVGMMILFKRERAIPQRWKVDLLALCKCTLRWRLRIRPTNFSDYRAGALRFDRQSSVAHNNISYRWVRAITRSLSCVMRR
jgi:hypothetical protein